MRYDVSLDELKQGYTKDNNTYSCLFCEQQYTLGDIYTFDERLVDASKAIELHIEKEHVSAFNTLILEGKKNTGMTDIQRELLTHFHNGLSDKEVAAITNTAPSTVRFQRYHLKEKARQAKVFLALFELIDDGVKEDLNINIHSTATMVDLRYNTTDEEAQKIIDIFFSSRDPLVLKTFSSKEKNKLVILRLISEQFQRVKRYEEKEVNDIIKPIYSDFATIRRYLIEYGFMDRTGDCKEYWLK